MQCQARRDEDRMCDRNGDGDANHLTFANAQQPDCLKQFR